MKYFFKENYAKGFTLLELLVVVGISAYLATLAYSSIKESREDVQVTNAGLNQKELTKATESYFRDMGFYPPDVNRGWDPGFEKPLPWNPDGRTDSGVVTSTVPSNWQAIVSAKWAGPYLLWPKETPWGGKYDYNYWPENMTRQGGCIVQKGIYAGVQGNYDNNNTIPVSAEGKMITKTFDSDGCLNGESQLILWRLQ